AILVEHHLPTEDGRDDPAPERHPGVGRRGMTMVEPEWIDDELGVGIEKPQIRVASGRNRSLRSSEPGESRRRFAEPTPQSLDGQPPRERSAPNRREANLQ